MLALNRGQVVTHPIYMAHRATVRRVGDGHVLTVIGIGTDALDRDRDRCLPKGRTNRHGAVRRRDC